MPPTARLIGIGFYIGICIAVGALGGRELDKLLDTGKLMTVSGLVLGVFLALYGGLTQLLEVVKLINRRHAGGSGK
jgi:hypothetical protein